MDIPTFVDFHPSNEIQAPESGSRYGALGRTSGIERACQRATTRDRLLGLCMPRCEARLQSIGIATDRSACVSRT
jgi:hypothetical protein